jgi:hypothetical protein
VTAARATSPGVKPDVAHLDWRTFIDAKPETPQATIDALDAYFNGFAQPAITVAVDGKKSLGKLPCLKCDEPLADGIMSFLTGKGGFTWGLAHGEGFCRNCRWPARAYHFIKDVDGNDLMTLRGVVLQYHPDFVSERKAETS